MITSIQGNDLTKKLSIQLKDFFSKNANVGIPETPSPLELANVCKLDPPPPPKKTPADVLYGRPLMNQTLRKL